jgi:hypothetical protein
MRSPATAWRSSLQAQSGTRRGLSQYHNGKDRGFSVPVPFAGDEDYISLGSAEGDED